MFIFGNVQLSPKIMTKPYGKIYKNKTNVSIDATDLYNVWPIGSIYISVINTNPSEYFGGTWEVFGTGRCLVGVDTSQSEFNTVMKTGGEKKHTLTVNEMPSHSHIPYFNTSWGSRVDYPPVGSSYIGPQEKGTTISYNGTSTGTYVQPNSGVLYNEKSGGGKAHNNLQPYITVYMWRRTS